MIPRATRLFLKKWRNALKLAQGETISGSLESSQKLKEGKDDKRTYTCSEYWEGKVDIKKSREAERKQKDCTDYWEGEAACSELQRNGLWRAVLAKPIRKEDAKQDKGPKRQKAPKRHKGLKRYKDWRLPEAIQDIASQIRLYRSQRGKVVKQNFNYRQADDFFERMSRQFEEEVRRTQLSQIQIILQEYVKQFGNTRRNLKQEQQRKLQRLWYPGIMGTILSRHQYRKLPIREVDLDMLNQILLANILRCWLPKPGWEYVRGKVFDNKAPQKVVYTSVRQEVVGISRRTIARLIVLIYMVGGFAIETTEKHLVIGYTRKKLTVPNVDQTLQRAGIE